MPNDFTYAFLLMLALSLATRLWLNQRQLRHVQQHRASVPAAFAEHIPLAAHQKAADYTAERSRLGSFSALLDAALLIALTLGGGIAWLAALFAFLPAGVAQGCAIILAVLGVSTLIDLPLAYYRQFVLEEKFGFNRMTPRLFFADLAKQLLLGLVIGLPVIAAILWLVGAMGEHWWFDVWLFWSGFNLLLMFIYPTWIAPLFNRFEPLPDGELRSRVEALLARCGFRASGLFVMDGSRRSAHGNAYFTGFGANKRIVFFDTLLARLSPAEIEAVLAHELGHFRHRHILQRLVMLFSSSLLLLWVLGTLAGAPWFYQGLGVPVADQGLALLLFFLVIPAFTFPLSPLGSLFSRRHEFQADAYAVAHASGAALRSALLKLYEDNAATLTPDPLYSLFHDSHPPAAQRIARLPVEAGA